VLEKTEIFIEHTVWSVLSVCNVLICFIFAGSQSGSCSAVHRSHLQEKHKASYKGGVRWHVRCIPVYVFFLSNWNVEIGMKMM